jgi:group I intron endonuclease
VNNSGIYIIRNNVNGNVYIGSSVNLTYRKNKHFSMLASGSHKNRHLQNAWNKYGTGNFSFKILLFCAPFNLLFYEQRAINAYTNRIYNTCLIAGSRFGQHMSDEHKEKLRATNIGNTYTLGRKLSDEHKAKIGAAAKLMHTGRKHSAESKRNMSLSHMGHIPSQSTRQKLSEAVRKSWLVEDIRNRRIIHRIGRRVSNDTKAKISTTLKGHTVSEESRIKMSQSHKNRTKGRFNEWLKEAANALQT